MSTMKDVADKLDTLIRLTAIGLFGDTEKTQKEKIEVLGTAGLSVREIAELLGTTPNTVNVTLSRLGTRKKKKKVGKKRPAGDANER